MSAVMSCNKTKSLLSQYLDSAMTGTEMQAVSTHLAACAYCSYEFALLRGTQNMVAGVGRRTAPPDLALRIKLAISREMAESPRRRLQGFMVHLQNAVHAFMVPATAGVLSAVICFCVVMGFFTVPAQLLASTDDIPATLYTPPELSSSPFGMTLPSHAPGALLVEAVVDPQGRVQDYRVLADTNDHGHDLTELKNMLIFTQFRPATSFGMPTTGRVVLSFAKINVRG
jgi:hypothetical protein